MAENPATWKSAEIVIDRELRMLDDDVASDVCGGTAAHIIAEALRESGHINDQEEPEQGPGAAFGKSSPEPRPFAPQGGTDA